MVASSSRLPYVVPVAALVVLAVAFAGALGRLVDRLPALPAAPPVADQPRSAPQDPIPARPERLPARRAEPVRRAAEPAPPRIAEVPSNLPYFVVGTLVSRRDDESLAAVVDARDGSIHSWRIGDTVEDAVVARIERARVLIDRAGRREVIDRVAHTGAANPASRPHAAAQRPTASATPPPPRATEGTAALAPTLHQTGPNEWSLQRDDVGKITGGMMQLGRDARIMPYFDKGTAAGFRLVRVRPGSLYTKMGLQNGDVLSRINGITLDSPEKMLGMYQQLQSASRVDIEVLRNGSKVTQTYRIQ